MARETLRSKLGRVVNTAGLGTARPVPTTGVDRTERYWSEAFAHGGITTWMSEPMVRRVINERVTGHHDEWPMEWFQFEHCPVIVARR